MPILSFNSQVNGLSFNTYTDWIVATASSDATIGLFDLRKLMLPLHVLSGHEYVYHSILGKFAFLVMSFFKKQL